MSNPIAATDIMENEEDPQPNEIPFYISLKRKSVTLEETSIGLETFIAYKENMVTRSTDENK